MVLLAAVEASSKLEEAIRSLVEHGSQLGFTIIKALIVFLVGRLVINLLNKLVRKILSKRDIDPSVKTFVGSLVNVSLTILLIISVVGALGVQTTSFAALLASAGVAVGMALSGNLSNFAGGLIILLFKPYKVGDYIEAQGVGGTVKEVQLFHQDLGSRDMQSSENTCSCIRALLHILSENRISLFCKLCIFITCFLRKSISIQPVQQLKIHTRGTKRILRSMKMQISQSRNDQLIAKICT